MRFFPLLLLLAVASVCAYHAPSVPCTSDAVCEARHAGRCAHSVRGPAYSRCRCPWGQRQRDLVSAACETESVPNVSTPYGGVIVYGDALDGSRYEAVPQWPAVWSCDAWACRSQPSTDTHFVMDGYDLALRTFFAAPPFPLSPLDVLVICGAGRRFFVNSFAPAASAAAGSLPTHDRHCMTCAEWCGVNGTCADPSTFACACAPGVGGARCDLVALDNAVRAASAVVAIGVYTQPVVGSASVDLGGAALALATLGGSTADVPVLASAPVVAEALTEATPGATGDTIGTPAWDLVYESSVLDERHVAASSSGSSTAWSGGACLADTDCLATQECVIDVAATLLGTAVVRVCVCAAGYVPVQNATASALQCAASQVVAVFGLRVDTYATRGTLTGPVGSVYIVRAETALNSTVVGAQALPFMPSTTRAVRVLPAFVKCAAGATTRVSASTSPATWCADCAWRCNGRAETCDATTCNCTAPFGGPTCNACADASYLMPNCTRSHSNCSLEVCSGRGLCVGEGGPCNCTAGWVAPSCALAPRACGAAQCTGHGACLEDGTSCVCDAGWTGDTCAVRTAELQAVLCGAHGTLDPETLACTCDTGWTGADCDLADCGAHGVRSDPTTCVCDAGWTDTRCRTSVCGVDTGALVNGTCVCVGVFRANTAGTYPVCSRHVCGAGQPTSPVSCTCDAGHTPDVLGDPVCVPDPTPVLAFQRNPFRQRGRLDPTAARGPVVLAYIYAATLLIISVWSVVPRGESWKRLA